MIELCRDLVGRTAFEAYAVAVDVALTVTSFVALRQADIVAVAVRQAKSVEPPTSYSAKSCFS